MIMVARISGVWAEGANMHEVWSGTDKVTSWMQDDELVMNLSVLTKRGSRIVTFLLNDLGLSPFFSSLTRFASCHSWEDDFLVNISIGIQIVLREDCFLWLVHRVPCVSQSLSVVQKSHKWRVSSCSANFAVSTSRVSIFCSSSAISTAKQRRFVLENSCFHRTPPGS